MAIKNFLLMGFRKKFEAAHQHQWIRVDALNLPYNNPLPPTKRCLTDTQPQVKHYLHTECSNNELDWKHLN